MIKIMFVCLGNICRSPMAEFMMKDYVKKLGREQDFYIDSSATSFEEIGNPVHYGTARVLDRLGINYSKKRAKKLLKEDYKNFDYFIGMDRANKRDMLRLFDGDKDNKVRLLLDFTDASRDIADPWYTDNFIATENDVRVGIIGLYEFLTK